ncbi:MAG: acetyl-CoA carboxylase biotin carboxyl carrier protein [Pseudomonadota bacterium]
MSDNKDLNKDLNAIRALADVLDETGLSEIEIERGSLRLRVSKSTNMTMVAPSAAPQSQAVPPTPAASGAATDTNEDFSAHPGAVTSPMVGTAYMSASPGAAPFITDGAEVKEGQTLMIVEAMKTMNEIKSPRSGKVTRLFARDAEPVEFGEVLMIIE